MREDIINIKNIALANITDASNSSDIEAIRLEHLGRKGKISLLFKEIPNLDPSEKGDMGILLNETKKTIEQALKDKTSELISNNLSEGEDFDLTIPGDNIKVGSLHPQTIVLSEILEAFSFLGFQIADGPEVEKDYYNFEVLNFPKDHPARDAQQTMFFNVDTLKNTNFGDYLPRTHTSAMQGRIMEKMKPPFRVVVPGRCFRYEQIDASHGAEFWQVEGFAVDENIKFTDLLGTIDFVLKQIFGDNAKIKFATTFFPFVEPGLDAYLQCTVCKGKGCSFCKKSGWSEIMPAGMIHPNVLKKSGIDPNQWRGFAFAIGLSRVVALKYGIDDLRTLINPDIRILKQF